jgi:hypothetical protein
VIDERGRTPVRRSLRLSLGPRRDAAAHFESVARGCARFKREFEAHDSGSSRHGTFRRGNSQPVCRPLPCSSPSQVTSAPLGHGVPGALISIVNYNLLNKAVLEKNITHPGDILDAVDVWLTESLHQTVENSTVKDGMDISLIAINKKTNEIAFSGANNPLYVYKKDEQVIEYKGDKFPVGYADQFGGEKGKKFKLKNQREQLKIARNLPIIDQRKFLHNQFSEWKGELEQVDDVLIIGIEL